jgi:hypothetical protein
LAWTGVDIILTSCFWRLPDQCWSLESYAYFKPKLSSSFGIGQRFGYKDPFPQIAQTLTYDRVSLFFIYLCRNCPLKTSCVHFDPDWSKCWEDVATAHNI